MTDDRTGFPQYAERTRMQWNRLRVDEAVWEPRQPQDLVKGVKDKQSVEDARPLSPAQFVGPLYYTLVAAYGPGSEVLLLQSNAKITAGDPVGVVLDMDGGAIFRTVVTYVGAGYIVILDPLPGYTSSGNEVVDYAPGSGVAPGMTPLLDSNGFPLTDSNGNVLYGNP